jgi:hypothetical protein
MTVHVWIPATTQARHRSLLPPGAEIHDLADAGPLPERLGPGQCPVASGERPRLQVVIPRIDDLHVNQTMSAGIDRLTTCGRNGPTLRRTLCCVSWR